MSIRLGVNIDHVATLRQARLGHEPEPVAAGLLAQGAGAHGITVHLRADRRHIQERDVRLLKEVLTVPLNVECAATQETLATLVPLRPDWVTLVPETREELTTQGGLDIVFMQAHLRQIIRELRVSDIRVSLFIDPQLDQVKMAGRLEADAVEFNTGVYADLPRQADPSAELERLRDASKLASRLGMRVLAGHGLTLQNVAPIAAIPEVEELNIGHSIIGRSVLVGLERAVQEMLHAIAGVRG
ncbi:MAG: Pyridoxine 5'-phosphate synthase [Acidobacteria bacterium ADurb.Bin340]|nr:MAG: Pyridoxine 5'-phosphate synthase [Acidobacteria bacterium ADurb.Bin340]